MKQIEEIYSVFKEVGQIFTDTRKIDGPGIFFALKGNNFNGNKYASKALELGCKLAVIDEVQYAINDQYVLVEDVLDALQKLARFHRNLLDIPVIGITGSNGKTTTKELLHRVLLTKYTVSATKGNFNNHIGVPLSLLEINESTEIAIIEMGTNSPGEIEALCQLANPTHGIITSIGKAHLEKLIDINGVLKEKTALYRHVIKRNGTLYVDSEDKLLRQSLGHFKNSILYSSKNPKQFRFKLISSFPHIKFEIDQHVVQSEMYGVYNITNMLCVTAVGLDFGISTEEISKVLKTYTPNNNRTQKVLKKGYCIYLDAYNANPSSMEEAIKEFGKENAASKILVLGAMKELGANSKSEHQSIINLVDKFDWARVLLFGEEWKACELAHQSKLFHDFTKLEHAFSDEKKNGKEILIKGSRSMALERLLNAG